MTDLVKRLRADLWGSTVRTNDGSCDSQGYHDPRGQTCHEAAARIEQLERDYKSVLNSETQRQARIEELEAENERLRKALPVSVSNYAGPDGKPVYEQLEAMATGRLGEIENKNARIEQLEAKLREIEGCEHCEGKEHFEEDMLLSPQTFTDKNGNVWQLLGKPKSPSFGTSHD